MLIEILIKLTEGALILASIIALAVIVERTLYLRRDRIINPDLVQIILNVNNPHDLKKSIDSIERQDGAFINIVRAALEHIEDSYEEMKDTIMDQGRWENRRLEARLGILETVASVTPLLGLLGTVLGMIKEFQENIGDINKIQEFSGGISVALITTVAGLSIAIPSLIAYNYFDHKVEDLIMEIEKYSSQLLKKMKIK